MEEDVGGPRNASVSSAGIHPWRSQRTSRMKGLHVWSDVWWPNIDKNPEDLAASCSACVASPNQPTQIVYVKWLTPFSA